MPEEIAVRVRAAGLLEHGREADAVHMLDGLGVFDAGDFEERGEEVLDDQVVVARACRAGVTPGHTAIIGSRMPPS